MADASPQNSFKGYSVWVVLKNNKDKIKLLITALGTYLTSLLVNVNADLKAFLLAAVGVVIYLAACAVDYYFTEVPLDKPEGVQ